MDSATVDATVSNLVECIETFLDEFEQREVPVDRATSIIEEGDEMTGKDVGQQPERFVEDNLVFPVLDALGYRITPRPNSEAGGDADEYPDFRVDNLPANVIGENKALNDVVTARHELLGYLDSAVHEYGFATDGYQWGLYEAEQGPNGGVERVAAIEPQSLRPVVQHFARERKLVDYTDDLPGLPNPRDKLAEFYQSFGHHNVRQTTGGLTRFHDKYAELLAGSGEYDHGGIDMPLLDAIEAPADAGESEQLAFAALLVDRLAFVRLMQDRGVLDVRLRGEWEEHDHGLNRFRGSFLENHLQPLFYDVLAVPSDDRDDPRAFGQPPHFAGGLFEPVLPREREYDVADEAMRDVLTAFIEGEVRTVINEAVHGSLLQSYRGSGEAELAGQMAEWYGDLTGRYDNELQYVEENIRPTLYGY